MKNRFHFLWEREALNRYMALIKYYSGTAFNVMGLGRRSCKLPKAFQRISTEVLNAALDSVFVMRNYGRNLTRTFCSEGPSEVSSVAVTENRALMCSNVFYKQSSGHQSHFLPLKHAWGSARVYVYLYVLSRCLPTRRTFNNVRKSC